MPKQTPLLNFIKHHELHQGWVLRTDLGGWSNHLGLIATLILLMLLVLSNDLTLRLLKGKRWKFLQRFSYGLFLPVVAHALGYQVIVDREMILRITVILVFVFVLIVQLFGFVTYRNAFNRKSTN